MLNWLRTLMPILILSLGLTACGGGGGDDGFDNGDDIGGGGDDGGGGGGVTSHNAGMNCMGSGCHVQGGAGQGVFTASGSVFKSNGMPQPDATAVLYLHNTNTIVASMDTDDSGNFYTTAPVEGLFTGGDPVQGVDVEIRAPGGTRTMPGLVTEGGCNVCHGAEVGPIIAN